MDKKQLRNTIREVLLTMGQAQYDEKSIIICSKLIQHPFIQKGKTIAVTMPNFPEVNIIPFIEQLWAIGKKVVIPKCNVKTKEMTFYQITSFEQTEIVYKDIREPIVALTLSIPVNQIDVCIVPGIVFDMRGYRIGFGGGYYDRFLSGYNNYTIAVAFQEQLVEIVPTMPYDLPVQQLITEKTTIDFEKEGQNENEKYD